MGMNLPCNNHGLFELTRELGGQLVVDKSGWSKDALHGGRDRSLALLGIQLVEHSKDTKNLRMWDVLRERGERGTWRTTPRASLVWK